MAGRQREREREREREKERKRNKDYDLTMLHVGCLEFTRLLSSENSMSYITHTSFVIYAYDICETLAVITYNS